MNEALRSFFKLKYNFKQKLQIPESKFFGSRNFHWKSLPCWFCVYIFGSVQIHAKPVDKTYYYSIVTTNNIFLKVKINMEGILFSHNYFLLMRQFFSFVSVSRNNLILSRKQIVNYFNIDFFLLKQTTLNFSQHSFELSYLTNESKENS